MTRPPCIQGVFLVIVVVCIGMLNPIAMAQEQSSPSSVLNDTHAKKILKQSEIEREARRLEKQGQYDEAIAKYREATASELLNHDWEAGVSIGGIERIYQKQGKFELALKELQWHLERNPSKYEDQRLELEALIKARDKKSTQPIYEHIAYLKSKYKNQLPPNQRVPEEAVVVSLICLYDYIGDYDAGIDFAENFLRFYKKIGPGNPYQPANPYFQVKQAFEADKKDDRKSCISAEPGEICMGRATQALTQSNYFAW